jgi:hypothetical protein
MVNYMMELSTTREYQVHNFCLEDVDRLKVVCHDKRLRVSIKTRVGFQSLSSNALISAAASCSASLTTPISGWRSRHEGNSGCCIFSLQSARGFLSAEHRLAGPCLYLSPKSSDRVEPAPRLLFQSTMLTSLKA